MNQLDASSTASDWIILVNHLFDERRAPSNQPRFENLSEEFQILWIELTEFWWRYVVTAELSVLKGPEIDWSWQRYFPSSYFDSFDSSLITKSFAKLMTYIRYDVNSDLLEQLKFISKNGLRKVRPFVKEDLSYCSVLPNKALQLGVTLLLVSFRSLCCTFTRHGWYRCCFGSNASCNSRLLKNGLF